MPVPVRRQRRRHGDDRLAGQVAIRGGSYVVVNGATRLPDYLQLPPTFVRKVRDVETGPRTAYVVSGKSTRLSLDEPWAFFDTIAKAPGSGTLNERNLHVYPQRRRSRGERRLPLAQEPVLRPVGQAVAEEVRTRRGRRRRIDLDAVVEGLQPGCWVIVSGERVDIPGTAGVISSELAMMASIELHPDAPAGGSAYSTLAPAPRTRGAQTRIQTRDRQGLRQRRQGHTRRHARRDPRRRRRRESAPPARSQGRILRGRFSPGVGDIEWCATGGSSRASIA